MLRAIMWRMKTCRCSQIVVCENVEEKQGTRRKKWNENIPVDAVNGAHSSSTSSKQSHNNITKSAITKRLICFVALSLRCSLYCFRLCATDAAAAAATIALHDTLRLVRLLVADMACRLCVHLHSSQFSRLHLCSAMKRWTQLYVLNEKRFLSRPKLFTKRMRQRFFSAFRRKECHGSVSVFYSRIRKWEGMSVSYVVPVPCRN